MLVWAETKALTLLGFMLLWTLPVSIVAVFWVKYGLKNLEFNDDGLCMVFSLKTVGSLFYIANLKTIDVLVN